MGNQIRKGIAALAVLLLAASAVSAQKKTEQADSLVRLMKGKSIELIDIGGISYRKAIESTILHNGTYFISDTALWNVDDKQIKAWGHIQVIQDETKLTSETLDYDIDANLAKFRGSVVQLENKQKNILRTSNLDYNTKDSIAVFDLGAAMRDKDGQVIESLKGSYDSSKKKFEFWRDVNMFTDSIFVRTRRMDYESVSSKATFSDPIDFWKDGYMLSAESGWYDRGRELFFFTGKVHALSENQEAWCDTLYYTRGINDVLMLGDVQVKDTTRNVVAMANDMHIIDTLKTVTLRKNAAVALRTEEENKVDTLYLGADTLMFRQYYKCDLPESVFTDAEGRLKDITTDAVTEYRRKAAQAAAEAAENARKQAQDGLAKVAAPKKGGSASAVDEAQDAPDESVGPDTPEAPEVPSVVGTPIESEEPEAPQEPREDEVLPSEAPADSTVSLPSPADSLLSPGDSLLASRDSLSAPLDSLAAPADSLTAALDSLANLPPPDSTKIGFAWAIRNVRIFRKDMQVRCDSMVFCDIDSLARFYRDPIVWNDGNRQYTSDSLFVLVKNNRMERASLMSNAFVITQEDTLCYDQIKATEVLAYFDTTTALSRFDALGGANAIFYLQENDAFATVNKVDSKMLSAIFKDGDIDRVYYFESPHNDAYPIVQLPPSERVMKGFNWMPDKRPAGPQEITTLKVKNSERSAYRRRPKARFLQTDTYFPGYMEKIYREIAIRDSLSKIKPAAVDTAALGQPVDSLGMKDSLAVADSLGRDSLAVSVPSDSTISIIAKIDSLTATDSSTRNSPAAETATAAKTPEQIRAEKKEKMEEARKLRIARRDARWAELDAKDAAKAEAKKLKALEKQRKKTLRAVLAKRRQDAADEAKLQRYIKLYEKRKQREDARKQKSESSRKRASGTQDGGEVSSPDGAGAEAPGSDALLRDDGLVDDDTVLRRRRVSRSEGGTGL